MHRSRVPCRRRPLTGSRRSRRWADSIIVTNAAPPEHYPLTVPSLVVLSGKVHYDSFEQAGSQELGKPRDSRIGHTLNAADPISERDSLIECAFSAPAWWQGITTLRTRQVKFC